MCELRYEDKPQYLEIEILTPTHVGVAKENYWVQFADFHYENKKVYRYDLFSYLKEKNDELAITRITDALRNGNSINNPYRDELKTQAEAKNQVYDLSINPGNNGIRPQIRTGMGFPILPGSSLKGAVRSVIYKALFKKKHKSQSLDLVNDIIAERFNGPAVKVKIRREKEETYKNLYSEGSLIGNFGNSLLSLFKLTDIEFSQNDTALFINQIRSIFDFPKNQNDAYADWKEERFDTVYECLKPNSKSVMRFMIAQKRYEAIKQNRNFNLPDGADEFLNHEKPLKYLFNIINNHTKSYIEKEKKFRDQWYHDDNEFIDFSAVENALKSCDENSCVLRMASGSGFHSITGDWQNPDDHHKRSTNQNDVFNKTRRFAVDGERFLPMGFVKLTIIDKATYQQRMEEHQRKVEPYLSKSQPSSESISIEEQAPPTKPKPEIPVILKEKEMGKKDIPAQILSWDKGNVKIKLLVEKMEDITFKLTQLPRNPIAVGTYIYVQNPDKKQKTAELQKLY